MTTAVNTDTDNGEDVADDDEDEGKGEKIDNDDDDEADDIST